MPKDAAARSSARRTTSSCQDVLPPRNAKRSTAHTTTRPSSKGHTLRYQNLQKPPARSADQAARSPALKNRFISDRLTVAGRGVQLEKHAFVRNRQAHASRTPSGRRV